MFRSFSNLRIFTKILQGINDENLTLIFPKIIATHEYKMNQGIKKLLLEKTKDLSIENIAFIAENADSSFLNVIKPWISKRIQTADPMVILRIMKGYDRKNVLDAEFADVLKSTFISKHPEDNPEVSLKFIEIYFKKIQDKEKLEEFLGKISHKTDLSISDKVSLFLNQSKINQHQNKLIEDIIQEDILNHESIIDFVHKLTTKHDYKNDDFFMNIARNIEKLTCKTSENHPFLMILSLIHMEIYHQDISNAIEILFEKYHDILDIRQLSNIIHKLSVLNPNYITRKTLSILTKSLENHTDLANNMVDFSSIIHAYNKWNLDLKPFLTYITSDYLSRASGSQIAIITYSLRNHIPICNKEVLKTQILAKISEMSPKHLIMMGLV